MEYVIGGLIAIIIIVIVALMLRKRLYSKIDYYEDWKLDIVNRNVANELSRVKELKLEGDTKERFEHWKSEWESILNEDMADVEELLYDTEKSADRYNFPGAKKHMNAIETKMNQVEEKIERILNQLHELLGIEETNRKDVEYIEPKLVELKKILSQNSYQYNRAGSRFENEINEIMEELKTYDALAEEGNYAEGAAIVEALKERTDKLEADIEAFPKLHKACKKEIPQQLDELVRGIKEMKRDGYHIGHLNLEQEISGYQGQLSDLVKELEEKGSEQVQKTLPQIETRIKEMYDLLEQEALARNYVESKMPNYRKALDAFTDTFLSTKIQVDKLKETYHFEDADLEKYLSLEKRLSHQKDQLDSLLDRIEGDHSHTTVRSELEAAFVQLETLKEEHEAFKESIYALRKDELDAREQLQKMSDDMQKLNRKLKHSNLPGVPDYIWKVLDEASKKNQRVLEALDKHPLDMTEVNQTLQEAKETVYAAIEQTDLMLEQAYLTERVIQYANRYRSSYPVLNSKLKEAENLFRNADYELSLERSANALEEIEPGALQKIEKQQELTVS